MKKLALASLAVLAFAGNASAESCVGYINAMYNGFAGDVHGAGHWFDTTGTRVTARSAFGYSSFAMHPSYAASQGMSNAATVARQSFAIVPNAAGTVIEGQFRDVFPGRSNGATDLTTLRIFRTGVVQIRLDAWGGATYNLSALQCYAGHDNNTFVMTGQRRDAGFGLDTWTFVFNPGWLL